MKTVFLLFDSLNLRVLENYGSLLFPTPNFKRLGEKTIKFNKNGKKVKKPTKKAARSHKSKGKVVAAPDQPADRKRAAAKKPARKAAKKASSKLDAKAGAKAVDTRSPAVSKIQTSREPISSAPLDVVKIGSDEPKSPRRGWWSRN